MWKCVVCEQLFKPHTEHSCTYTGVGLRKKLDDLEARLSVLESQWQSDGEGEKR